MKFFQIKYLTFYLVIFILIPCFLSNYINQVGYSHIPLYVFAVPVFLIYIIVGVAYFFLKKIKDQPKYIDIGINIGAIVLAVFTIGYVTIAFLRVDIKMSYLLPILIFVFSYQALVVIYAIVIGVLRA